MLQETVILGITTGESTFFIQNQKLNLVHPRVSLRRQNWAAMGMVIRIGLGTTVSKDKGLGRA